MTAQNFPPRYVVPFFVSCVDKTVATVGIDKRYTDWQCIGHEIKGSFAFAERLLHIQTLDFGNGSTGKRLDDKLQSWFGDNRIRIEKSKVTYDGA